MKKKIEITIFILILLLIGVIGIILFNLFYDRTNYIKGHDYLYDVAIDYLRSHKDDLHRGDDYQQIISYHGFGISSDDKYQYAYMWILEESYYVKDQKLYSGSGSSMAYKFTFRNDKVVRYEIPLDGSNYASSMKKIFL